MSFRTKWTLGSLGVGALVVTADLFVAAPGIVIVSDAAYFFTLGPLSILYSAGLDWLERLDRRSGGSVSAGILVLSGLGMIVFPLLGAAFVCVLLLAGFGMLAWRAPGWLMTRRFQRRPASTAAECARRQRFAAVAAEQKRELHRAGDAEG